MLLRNICILEAPTSRWRSFGHAWLDIQGVFKICENLLFWLSLLFGGSLSRLRNIWFHRQLKYSPLLSGSSSPFTYFSRWWQCCLLVVGGFGADNSAMAKEYKNKTLCWDEMLSLVIMVVGNILFWVSNSNKWMSEKALELWCQR